MDYAAFQQIPNQNKSILWKVGMIYLYYFLAFLIVILTFNAAIHILLGQGYLITVQMKMEETSGYVFYIIGTGIGLLGIRYGVNYVCRRSIIERGDVRKIIIGFSAVEILLHVVTRDGFDSTEILHAVIVLVINIIAIKFFFQKYFHASVLKSER